MVENADLINGKIYPTLAVSAEKPPLTIFAKPLRRLFADRERKICKPQIPQAVGSKLRIACAGVPLPDAFSDSGYSGRHSHTEIFRRSAFA